MKKKAKPITHIFVLLMLGLLTLSLCGCEVKSELPVYQQASLNGQNNPPEKTSSIETNDPATDKFIQEAVYVHDEALLAEIEDSWLHKTTSYAGQFGKYLGIRELTGDEIRQMQATLNELIANFYNWNYTSHNEEHLKDGYDMLNCDLQKKISETKCFEQLINDVYAYTFDTKIRYANILDHNVAFDYQSEKYGRVSCLRAELVLHTVADPDDTFYDLYDYYVKGDTLLELLVFVRDLEGLPEVLAWEEFFCNPDHLTVYYPEYVGQISVQPGQINEINVLSLYEPTNETHSFNQEELANIRKIISDFIESNILIQFNWQPSYALFSKEQCMELESRAAEVAEAVKDGQPQIEMRDLSCNALDRNEFEVLIRRDSDSNVYKLTLTYMLKNSGSDVYQLMLYAGIYTYSTDIILIYEDDTFKVDYWKTKYTSDGALDIDFDALTVDQG